MHIQFQRKIAVSNQTHKRISIFEQFNTNPLRLNSNPKLNCEIPNRNLYQDGEEALEQVQCGVTLEIHNYNFFSGFFSNFPFSPKTQPQEKAQILKSLFLSESWERKRGIQNQIWSKNLTREAEKTSKQMDDNYL